MQPPCHSEHISHGEGGVASDDRLLARLHDRALWGHCERLHAAQHLRQTRWWDVRRTAGHRREDAVQALDVSGGQRRLCLDVVSGVTCVV
jgi:hypothetical protein